MVYNKVQDQYRVLYAIALIYGVLSAYIVNDTLTLMGTPIVLSMSKVLGVSLKALLLLVAFSITIGLVIVGNPLNMLIAPSSGIQAPFIAFTKKLLIPTIINLVLTTAILIKLYGIRNQKLYIPLIPSERIRDGREAILGSVMFVVTLLLFVLNDVFKSFGLPHLKKRGLTPFITASVCYILSKNPRKVLEGVSWGTIIFFITMFITMNGIWRSGALTPLLSLFLPQKTTGVNSLLGITRRAIILSQLLSNVPFTSLYIEYMKNLDFSSVDVNAWITLAMSATIAGNFTILGAASNIILLEVIEQRGRESLTFTEFFRVGSIVTLVNLLVYMPFIILIP